MESGFLGGSVTLQVATLRNEAAQSGPRKRVRELVLQSRPAAGGFPIDEVELLVQRHVIYSAAAKQSKHSFSFRRFLF